ncbi:MAG: hypothetical protein ABWX73_13825 [Marmoricola sp.]
MLGRNSYTTAEIAAAHTIVERQLTTFRTAAAQAGDTTSVSALEPVFFNTALVALDRLFVHRVRTFTGKDTNPLSEVELLTESLLDNDGVLREIKVIKYDPTKSVLGLQVGDRIALTADDFEQLASAFLDDVQQKSD